MKTLRFSRSTQKGVALFVSLMMLILVTILGVTGVRMVSLEEKMAGNSYDRNLAFQAAEAALREAEKYVEDNKPAPPIVDNDTGPYEYAGVQYANCPTSPEPIDNCDVNSVCPKPDKDCPSRWILPDANFDGWKSATTSLSALSGDAPQYFIEYLGAAFYCNDSDQNYCLTHPTDAYRCGCKRYRVTARSNPGTGRATVMLQSIYATN